MCHSGWLQKIVVRKQQPELRSDEAIASPLSGHFPAALSLIVLGVPGALERRFGMRFLDGRGPRLARLVRNYRRVLAYSSFITTILVAKAAILVDRESPMTWAIRTCALALGAAALLSAQTVYAAPGTTQPAVDPLVSLSVLGTPQARSAVCAAGASAATASAAAAAQVVTPAPGCLLPVTTPAPAPVGQPVLQPGPVPGPGFNPLLGILGALLLAGLFYAVLSGDDDADGDLAPISPA